MIVDVYHNILWPKYKNEIFSALQKIGRDHHVCINILHIAETEVRRRTIPLNYNYTDSYKYQLLYKGEYEDISKIRLTFRMLRMIAASKADLLIIPGYHEIEHWVMLMTCLLTGKKAGVFCDSTKNDNFSNRSFIKKSLKKIFFHKVSLVLAYGERSREYAISMGARADTVYQPCSSAGYPHREVSHKKLIEIKKSQEKKIVLYVGRLSKEKNLEALIKAFSMLPEQEGVLELAIVGGGEHEVPLKKLAEEMKSENSIVFKGPMSGDRLAEEYSKADVFVLPSWSEPWGLVVNEALYYGCFVVVSELCGCLPELVDESTGSSFQPSSEVELKEKIIEGLHVSKDERFIKMRRDRSMIYTPEYAAGVIFKGISSTLRGA